MADIIDLDSKRKDDGEVSYRLLFEFVNDSHDFILGFEAGQIYDQMKMNVPIIDGMFHWDNMQQISVMAKAMNYQIVNDERIIDGWVNLKLTKIDGVKP